MVISSSQCFSAAVERLIRGQPHGFQKSFAKKIRISPQYLSDLLAGRKFWPDEHKDRAAQTLGHSVSDLLQIGQIVMESGQFFPYIREVSALTPNSEERAEWIMKRAARDEGIGDVRCFAIAAVKIWNPSMLVYLNGKETDADLYEQTRAVSRRILRKE